MEYRQLGRSGLTVPVLSFGTGTFGGTNEFFQRWGQTDVAEATRMVDLCLDSGVNFFDTADIYSGGASEEILGQALKGKRERALISTKATFRFNDDLNQVGSSRHHLVRACEASLKRLGTEHIDVYFMHGFDALTPVEETLRALDDLTRSGKIGYIGASNFSGWHLMKALATSERYGLARYVAYQGYYSLIGLALRVGADAARHRPGRGPDGLESAWLGPSDRQNSPWAAEPERPHRRGRRRGRAAGVERVPLWRGRCAG